MAKTQDKGQTTTYGQADMMGSKPHGAIGGERTAVQSAVSKVKVKKANALRAAGSTSKSGQEANVGKCVKAIGTFVNR